ncbi:MULTISPECIES: 2-polyprenyl-3-methyl-6-methoxy-1,4-benzoquinone monooxygenase [Acinetobacter]|jgi:ubiquinone biosynthesis monooxygenase Coq7|uniref:3-demethoxyubiquinol 3-hydroxylase n=3 Tax=Acinetobacter schindleri TaxID=108981 RepID=N8Z7C1_9GAMM|nr:MULTISPECIES: 2-polyprenyl-3-methyl-6-methoxy-1,4-benzoquinone monooxygenase [Acinetobacter]APX63026.1 2-nonaprenyl-3-methyl-6-methoxy-1,4-benzoquinol hydroxylase protein Coq7 [Acinetobacter schindleri]AWD68888.1 2-polyprenyl-3-methyl-6-methoxy-1,4-benzoquinone monooxygenase [Acinetobacter schindleri]EIM39864.1 ubiquinone biosynthesis protein [Acinetobacter sp. HA]ENV12780.1 2-nonaprenyl-3-methyl-6-methoxy-1,4-benzoquinol hydroxylase [Acinetobacter schindleri NIPH 900]ENV44841.1 2-nonapreny
MRQFTGVDKLIHSFDQALRSLVPGTTSAQRTNPAENTDSQLAVSDARHVAGLMRVNHSGEVCAQALYHGQAMTAKLPNVRREMEQAAIEEQDHLAWCEDRLKELESHTSLLNPVWYGLSFGMGAIAGIAGDKYSLGFVAETERQVSLHLQHHISQLPPHDERSRRILEQMNEDELHHRDTALAAGGVDLPLPVKIAMTGISKLMTKTSYYI